MLCPISIRIRVGHGACCSIVTGHALCVRAGRLWKVGIGFRICGRCCRFIAIAVSYCTRCTPSIAAASSCSSTIVYECSPILLPIVWPIADNWTILFTSLMPVVYPRSSYCF